MNREPTQIGPNMLSYAVLSSPLGPLTFVGSDAGLRAVLWPHERSGRVPLPDGMNEAPEHPVIARAMAQVQEYFAAERHAFDVPLDLHGTAFQVKVWRLLAEIPYGRTVSYGEQAGRLGDARKARAVGAANGRNPVSIVLPCHRVVGADGSLTGFAGGLDAKRYLLAFEARQDAGDVRSAASTLRRL
jgi:methylated-DNA-[protein]-cysteine S-methyltransferase